ncbi:MAG: response regulator [bacterium]|nr:response regulator [bacterium]
MTDETVSASLWSRILDAIVIAIVFRKTAPANYGASQSPGQNLVVSLSRDRGEFNHMEEKKRILVVDDKASDTSLVKQYLERTNEYVVREENNSEAALAAAEEFQPHLILLDVMMPGIDGGDLVTCFQKSQKLKAVPIVFLTAFVTKRQVEEAGGEIGGFPFLAKPVVLEELRACLKHHLEVADGLVST